MPRCCASCGRIGADGVLCSPCRMALPWLEPAQCICPARGPTPKSLAVVALQGEARSWIHRFKYPGRGLMALDPSAMGVARFLARTVGARAEIAAADWIVPIPLHPRRYRQRGFNPSALLAREIARLGGNPANPRWLVRVRATSPQAGLDAKTRRRNVAGAFACRPIHRSLPDRVWLVDDVTTTGATLAAAGEALRSAGVREVIGLCLARTLGGGER